MSGSVDGAHDGETFANVDISNHVDRILHSDVLKSSGILRDLLLFLGHQYDRNPQQALSEHELAVAVFGRASDFDPRIDSVVRVHIGRLRAKLAEYYVANGSDDSIRVEIPKGRYCLVIHGQHPLENTISANLPASDKKEVCPGSAPKRRSSVRSRSAALALVMVALLGASVVLVRLIQTRVEPSALRLFWREFVDRSEPPLVVFSSPRFVGTSATGLRAFRPEFDLTQTVNDSYSGSGEVLAVYRLCTTFSQLHRLVQVKSSRLLTWDQATRGGLICLGAPGNNPATREVHVDGFRFDRLEQTNALINERAKGGEPRTYLAPGPPYSIDYAVVAYTRSPTGKDPAVILAGTNTYGTQAAAEFVTDNRSVDGLIHILKIPAQGMVPPFVAVLTVKIIDGSVVNSRIVYGSVNGRTVFVGPG